MENPNKVSSCLIFLVNMEELEQTNVAPHVYLDIVPDEILLPTLRKLSTPVEIKTISFTAGKFSTLSELGADGKIRIFSLGELAKQKISLPPDSKNRDSLDILTAIADSKKEIGAVIYLPN